MKEDIIKLIFLVAEWGVLSLLLTLNKKISNNILHILYIIIIWSIWLTVISNTYAVIFFIISVILFTTPITLIYNLFIKILYSLKLNLKNKEFKDINITYENKVDLKEDIKKDFENILSYYKNNPLFYSTNLAILNAFLLSLYFFK